MTGSTSSWGIVQSRAGRFGSPASDLEGTPLRAANSEEVVPPDDEAADDGAADDGADDDGAADATSMTPDSFLASQEALLRVERQAFTEQAAALRAEADTLAQEMEPGDIQFDEESGEGATATVDRERDLTLSAQAVAAVVEIDHALAKFGSGTYGVCESCGKPIPRPRLRALPQARLCVACKSGGLSRR
ncbi:MAG: TraR/DksA family transcriptional regulator [Acidimicrobiales bacterium]